MSLLLKALQNAAKNREAASTTATSATPGADASPQPPAASRETGAGVSSSSPSSSSASELSLEPVQPAARTQTPPRVQSSTRQAQAGPLDEPVERTGGPSPSQARSVLRAGAPAKAKGPGFFDWVARRPLVAFSTAAGLFAIGYGVYLYLQITNPGVFVAQRTPPPPPAVAQAPVPPQPPAPSAGQPIPPIAPPGQPEPLAAPAASVTAAPAAPAPGMTPAGIAQQPTAMQSSTGVTSATGGTAGAVPATTPPPAAAAISASPAPSAGSTQSAPAPTRPAGATASPIVATATPGADAAPATKPRPAPRPAGAPAAKRAAPDGVAAATASQIVPVDATLASAYQALEKGQLNDAERMYRQALASNPNSIDAMLGLASTVAQQNKGDAAIQLYLRVLEKDPRNAYAQAGLLAIGGRADPVAAEARLKQLIARDPSAFLYFTLGNLYSEQGQWAGAQSAYFQAHNLAPDNPDYAFNLAVGLEHVSQPRIALDYYRRALTLAQARGNAQFDPARVQTRIRSLESALAEKP